MEYQSKVKDGVLTLSLRGELDHHGAAAARAGIDAEIEKERPKKVVLNLKEVCFCDSSGLGLLMGRYNKARQVGAVLTVSEPSAAVDRIMSLAGLNKLIKTERGVEK